MWQVAKDLNPRFPTYRNAKWAGRLINRVLRQDRQLYHTHI